MGILDKIKADAQRTSGSRSKIFYIKDGEKRIIRFLNDMEDALEIPFHSNYEKSIGLPCRELFGKKCKYCNDEDVKTRTMYAWSVWDYDAEEVRIFMYAMNNCSPVGAVVSMYEEYGTLTDRDYIIKVQGKQTNKTFTVIPGDKKKFRLDKAKPLSKSAMLKILEEAYPDKDGGYEDKGDGKYERSKDADDGDDGFLNTPDGDETWEETGENYEDMTAKELFKLCKERNIEAEPKKPEKYYINLLKENDKAKDEWDDSEDGEWEDA